MPRSLFLLCLILMCFTNIGIAQPNIVATAGSIATSTVNHCQNFECSFTLKNTGTLTSSTSTTYLEIANNTTFTSPIVVSGSAVRSLTVGDSTTLFYTFSVPSYIPSGSYYVYVVVAGHYWYLTTPFAITPSTSHSTKIPYPIIFIHGLNSKDLMWNDLTDNLNNVYGLQSGGRMNFCLNYDGNDYTSIHPSDYHDFYTFGSLSVGDYYTVNFAVNPSNNWDTSVGIFSSAYLSNQSAIFKQGRAIRDAIKHVMQVTGRDKVILVGHSMGGLASREYLENSAIWQPDGKHHVAKLFTIGTPHGGSNANFSGIGAFAGVNQHSEAVRDLHYYVPFLYSGVFLGGGIEPTGITDYYNDDVNCNGIMGEAVTGLNQKYLPSDISYACTIGTGSVLGGDGVVDATRANINSYPGGPYLTYAADTFVDNQYSIGETHTKLPKNFEIDMKGLDEDNYYNNDFPYHVDLNSSYYGFIQQQSASGGSRDYDNYSFKCTQKGTLNIKIENIIAPDFKLWLVDSSNPTFALYSFPLSSNQNGNIDVQIQLPVGKYILETDAAPVTNGYFYPYLIKTAFTSNWVTTSYSICAGSTITLTAPSGFSSYQWALNGSLITGVTTQSISATAAGYYSFRTTNNFGYVGPWSDSVHLNVTPLPTSGVITGLSSVCPGAQITLTDAIIGGIWSASNGNATVVSGVVTGITAGTNIISYTVSNSCGTASATKVITVNPLSNPGTISGSASVCVGSTLSLTNAASGGIWSASNSNASVAGGVVTGISAGVCTISYSVTNLCGTQAATKPITINALPNAGAITGTASVCLGASITLAENVGGGIWSASNGNASVLGGVVTGHSAGTCTISYSVSNMCGTNVATKTININPLPEAGLINGANEVCEGETITLNATISGGAWICNDATATVSNDGEVSGLSAGGGTISYSTTNSCGVAYATKQITVEPKPGKPVISQNFNLLSTTSVYPSYQWFLNGTPISGATDVNYTAGAVGTYEVTVTNAFSCANTSLPLTLSNISYSINDIKVYPNPTASVVYISWYKKVSVRLTLLDGKMLKEIQNTDQIDLVDFPNGNYLLIIFDENKTKLQTQLITKITK